LSFFKGKGKKGEGQGEPNTLGGGMGAHFRPTERAQRRKKKARPRKKKGEQSWRGVRKGPASDQRGEEYLKWGGEETQRFQTLS